MRVGIIGAGISGLSTALALRKAGHEVDIFQREADLGGLIATFDFDGIDIEHFYHFLCTTDMGYFKLCQELRLSENLRFPRASTGFYYAGTPYNFQSPLDLLRFPGIPFTQRIRLGMFALEARSRKEWAQLDELTAKPWLIDRLGEQCYKVIWEPLLELKFGDFHDKISAAWVWHRIFRVAKSKGRMGYLEGGTKRLLDTLRARLDELGVTIHPEQPVSGILAAEGRVTGLAFAQHEDFSCDRVVSTVPLKVLSKLIPTDWEDYAAELARIDYIGVVCVSLKLKKAVSKHFWYNVNDERIPFNGIIEYTNLNPMSEHDYHIVYVPYYVATDHPSYTMSDEDVVKQSWDAMKLMNTKLSDDDLVASHVARTPYAQAICPTGFLKMIPEHKAPLEGLRLLDSTFLYPEDRTQSGHILKAYECAERIEE
ncbi:MAG: NAD(P)/FAD-dependent oxidoreductase [Candidatus Hydrogenedentes bacterium]|nr:NAD(P)/FAD-dependent oxidoreductase [Candidatus Hydrogenedentota bacterium]